jgi:hypothetical protein
VVPMLQGMRGVAVPDVSRGLPGSRLLSTRVLVGLRLDLSEADCILACPDTPACMRGLGGESQHESQHSLTFM